MVALRTRSLGAFSFGPFWLSAFCAALAPTSIGYQDLAALFARQPGVSERWRDHLIASPFGTIHAATFSFARPIGTAMPEPPVSQPVNFDPNSLDVKMWSVDVEPLARPALDVEYPKVNRRLKGDRLPLLQPSPPANERESLPQLQPIDAPAASPPARPPAPFAAPRPKNAEQLDTAPSAAAPDMPAAASVSQRSAAPVERGSAPDSEVEDDIGLADQPPEIPRAGENDAADAAPPSLSSLSFLNEEPAERNGQLYFGVAAMGLPGGLQHWAPGAEPVLVSPAVDPDIKLSALEGRAGSDAGGPGGETVARKDDSSRMESPAVRLGLLGKPRVKAEKCLSDAVYFEARGEPLRGQMAVAQVVMNRVFSGYYPNNVCGVVYQNANRHLACQFTFACDGIPDVVNEPDMWAQAKRIARDTLDGKIWLAEVGHATHYHAYWVHPSWVHEMKKMYKLGVHTFYRPRAWGDGSDAPIWGNVPGAPKPEAARDPAPAAKTPDIAAWVPQAPASPPATPAPSNQSTARL